ncbi:hypothetical protein OROHE_022973 [Orobanche hederae]
MAFNVANTIVLFLLSLTAPIQRNFPDLVKKISISFFPSQPQFDLNSFLERYGYLEYAQINLGSFASEPQIIEFAIKAYQETYRIAPTGILDSDTLSKMKAPRCRSPDFIDGVNSMQAQDVIYGYKTNYERSPPERMC